MSRLGWGGNIDAETNAFVGCCCKIILNWQLAKVKRPPQLPLTHVTIYFHFAFDLLWSSNLRWRQGYTSNVATILSNNINVNMYLDKKDKYLGKRGKPLFFFVISNNKYVENFYSVQTLLFCTKTFCFEDKTCILHNVHSMRCSSHKYFYRYITLCRV